MNLKLNKITNQNINKIQKLFSLKRDSQSFKWSNEPGKILIYDIKSIDIVNLNSKEKNEKTIEFKDYFKFDASPNLDIAIYYDNDKKFLYSVDIKTNIASEFLTSSEIPFFVMNVKFNRNGNFLLVTGKKESALVDFHKKKVMYKIPYGDEIASSKPKLSQICDISNDGMKIIFHSANKVFLHDHNIQKEKIIYRSYFHVISKVSFSKDNKKILFFEFPFNSHITIFQVFYSLFSNLFFIFGEIKKLKLLKVFDLSSSKVEKKYKGILEKIDSYSCCCVNADLSLIAYGNSSGYTNYNPVEIWDTTQKKTIAYLRDYKTVGGGASSISGIEFNCEETLLALSSDFYNPVEIWGIADK